MPRKGAQLFLRVLERPAEHRPTLGYRRPVTDVEAHRIEAGEPADRAGQIQFAGRTGRRLQVLAAVAFEVDEDRVADVPSA